VGIAWPVGIDLHASERDSSAPLLKDIEGSLPFVFRA
jgi:hypothetical protein